MWYIGSQLCNDITTHEYNFFESDSMKEFFFANNRGSLLWGIKCILSYTKNTTTKQGNFSSLDLFSRQLWLHMYYLLKFGKARSFGVKIWALLVRLGLDDFKNEQTWARYIYGAH